jgi:hypothetical protein
MCYNPYWLNILSFSVKNLKLLQHFLACFKIFTLNAEQMVATDMSDFLTPKDFRPGQYRTQYGLQTIYIGGSFVAADA